MAQLTNKMEVAAQYNDMPTTAESTVILELGNMNLLKIADQDPWLDGPLTYTITLQNVEDTGNITEIVFSDTIDITKSQLLTDTVTINGVSAVLGTDFSYNAATGELTIPYNTALAPSETVTVIFQVRKV